MKANFIKILKKDAQKLKNKLLEDNIYLINLRPESDEKYVYFPIKDKLKGYTIVSKEARKYGVRTTSLKDILKELGLKGAQIKTITSYDTVGKIAILKITEAMEPKETEIAKALLSSNAALETIVKKTKKHHGVYRVQSVKWLAGKKTLETIVKESGALFKIRVGEMFFSPRLCFERDRIAQLVKPKADVAVFFSGVAPFSIAIAKQQPEVNKVYSIELNPKAHIEALENIKLNKVEDKVEAICDDVNNFSENLKDWADNIVMPLPKTANLFIESAFKTIKKGKKPGLVSLYQFAPIEDPYKDILKQLGDFAKSKGYKIKVEFKREVRKYSPKVVQVVVDFRFIK